MMTLWEIKNTTSESSRDLKEKSNPIILRLLENRGIKSEREMENFFSFDYENDLADPDGISGMEKAVERIKLAKENFSAGGEKIAIFGDYDADGVTATALLFETLTDLGFSNLMTYIPDRQLEGYGMNEKAVEYLHHEGVKLIITVDCGTTNFSEVEKANSLGMEVIITDHHHVPDKIPKALSIINPNLKESGFKSKDLAGVGVALKLAQALYKKMDPGRIDQLKWMLDLVCIGTIADCVPLLFENRVLAKYGLVVLSKTRRVGLQEMFKVGRIDISENNVPDSHRVAFQIAPRINASGRMDHASTAYKLIMEKDRVSARELALEVESKNQERQKITGQIVKEVQILAQNAFKNKKFIIAANPHWPVGILGLVAGKIADEFGKPTVICQKQSQDLVGSLRSIPEVDIMEILEECSGILDKFGGHAQAAGIKLSIGKAEEFYKNFERAVEKRIISEIPPALEIDLEIRAEDVDWNLMEGLKKMEPFGEGNPEPVFLMRNMCIIDLKICGNGSKHLKLSLRQEGNSPKIFDSIGFGFGEKFSDLKNGDKIDAVFNLCEDSWNGNRKIQLKLVDLKKV